MHCQVILTVLFLRPAFSFPDAIHRRETPAVDGSPQLDPLVAIPACLVQGTTEEVLIPGVTRSCGLLCLWLEQIDF